MPSSTVSYLLLPHPLLPSSNLHTSLFSLRPTTTAPRRRRYRLHHARFTPISSLRSDQNPPETILPTDFGRDLLNAFKKPLAMTILCAAAAAVPLFLPAHSHAVSMPIASTISTSEIDAIPTPVVKHEFSDYSQRLLQVAEDFLNKVKAAKSHSDLKSVESALKTVKLQRKRLALQVLEKLRTEKRSLLKERNDLIRRMKEVLPWTEVPDEDSVWDNLRMVLRSRKKMVKDPADARKIYLELSEQLQEIDNKKLRLLITMANVAREELSFIVRECELLLERLKKRLSDMAKSQGLGSSGRMSKYDIQEQLSKIQREYLEQRVLPEVTWTEDSELFADDNTRLFILNVKKAFKMSQDLQRDLEDSIRSQYKSHGDEKVLPVKTPDDEIVKGFPELELKWMFGQREVVIPKAIRLQLFHGWKQWREQAKEKLKKKLIEDVDYGKEYIRKMEERILINRDRLIAKTWYNEHRKRWELDPVAVPFAISKKLVEKAVIRQDWAAMWVAFKGDEKEYFVDIKEYDLLFEEYGGFDDLYMKMFASGTPTSVSFMWIPLSDMEWNQQLLFLVGLSRHFAIGLWKSGFGLYWRNRVYTAITNIHDDLMTVIGFPFLELLPYPIRAYFGIGWFEGSSAASGWYMTWQSNALLNYKSRRWQKFWVFWFLFRSIAYCYVAYHVACFLWRVPSMVLFGPCAAVFGSYTRVDPNLSKLQRVNAYYNFEIGKCYLQKKEGIDPVRSAFDQMKRVKNPPICLNNFSGIDFMREEINEIVAFLQNPAAFQEMGARAPRGVLIVGDRGSGKTSLALAIAAEANVPVVEVKADQLEGGQWVGQGAANVRELFQTARDLAPVIIFVEDFDLFAGIRGESVHITGQDHESFINQLLVELDGFEKQDGVVILATTRNLRKIDPALQRPGRMDRVLHLQMPTIMEREKLLHVAAKETMDEDLVDYVDWGKVAEKTCLLMPEELKFVPMSLEVAAFRNKLLDTDELLTYCGWLATFSNHIPNWLRLSPPGKKVSKWIVNHLGLELSKEDLNSAVDLMEPYGKLSNGIELFSPPTDWSRESKLPHAIWAAGRGLIALLLPNFDLVDHIWLEPHSWEGIGYTKITKAKSEDSSFGNVESRSYLEKKLVFCFGSYIASQMLLPFGEENLLSQSELKQAQEIATRMVIQYGWGPDDKPTVYFHNKANSLLHVGDESKIEMGANVEKIYNLAYEKAKDMLLRNSKVLEKIVEDLLEFEGLNGQDLLKILEECEGIREVEPFFLTEHHKEVGFGGLLNGNASGVVLAMR